MHDTQFHALAAATLTHLADALDAAYEAGALDDVALDDGVLTIVTESGRTFVVSKHAPTQQIWLASPLSGGLHFAYDEAAKQFRLNDGRELHAVLRHDLMQSGVEVAI